MPPGQQSRPCCPPDFLRLLCSIRMPETFPRRLYKVYHERSILSTLFPNFPFNFVLQAPILWPISEKLRAIYAAGARPPAPRFPRFYRPAGILHCPPASPSAGARSARPAPWPRRCPRASARGSSPAPSARHRRAAAARCPRSACPSGRVPAGYPAAACPARRCPRPSPA